MPSLWQALRRGESVRERRRQLELAHERFVGLSSSTDTPHERVDEELRARFPGLANLRPVVFESWLRSKHGTIDPDRVLDRPALDEAELAELRRTHPISQVMPVVRRLLFDEARESGLIVAVGDAAGRLLWVDGDRELRAQAAEMGFRAGMDWSERSVGTSAPGSALALNHAIQVLGAEHFNRAVHNWSCTAAPVHDPLTGEIIGVVDVTGGDSAASPHLLPLLQATLAAIEAELQLVSLRLLLEHGRPAPSAHADQSVVDRDAVDRDAVGRTAVDQRAVDRDPTLALDPDSDPDFVADSAPRFALELREQISVSALLRTEFTPRLRVLGQDPALLEWADGSAPLTGRHAEILLALTAAPQGLPAAVLAEQVYGKRASEQTLRAELVRLRRWLELERVPLELGSRPYRLTTELRVDAAEALAALEQGAHSPALSSYAGPVLPGSIAPVAETLRADVAATLREAMLEFASPDALYDYAQRWAMEDEQVWETLLQVLPPRSPKRARVVARLTALRSA